MKRSLLVETLLKMATGGGGANLEALLVNDVNFYDYDGVIVASYTAIDFANLTAMPNNPTHDGLTAQGWNWSLDDAKAYVAKYGKLNVGQTYITDDGKTRLYIRLEDGRLAPFLGIAIDGTATVDWDDGSTSTVTGTSTSTVVNTQHNYATAGNYVITITVSGSMALLGSTSTGSQVLWKADSRSNKNRVYQSAIKKVEIGANTAIGDAAFENCCSLASVTIPNGVTLSNYAFYYCYSLASITIPDGVTKINNYSFEYCFSLKSVAIPNSVIYMWNYVFAYCHALTSITIPSNVTSISSYMFEQCHSLVSIIMPDTVSQISSNVFYECRSLASINIPKNVTYIQNYAFYDCNGLGYIKFERTTPPIANGAYVFNNIPDDCIIYIPRGTLSSYASAANYPSSSTYTYVEY